jgi:hypothetical protein
MKKGSHMSAESRAKMRASALGRKASPETRAKMSLMRKGRRQPMEAREKMSLLHKGEKNPMFGKRHSPEELVKMSNAHKGKHHSPETKKKMSLNKMGEKHPMFGKHQSEEWRRNRAKSRIGQHHSIETRRKIGRKGEKNPAWRGGISFAPYTTDWTHALRISIRERDHYICQMCGEKQGDLAHSVHHIDYIKANCNPQNLITLCRPCHMKTNVGDRKKWTAHFQVIMGG